MLNVHDINYNGKTFKSVNVEVIPSVQDIPSFTTTIASIDLYEAIEPLVMDPSSKEWYLDEEIYAYASEEAFLSEENFKEFLSELEPSTEIKHI